MSDTQLLRDLLAVIHSDGGQHTDDVGLEKSTKDAIELYYNANLLIDRLTHENEINQYKSAHALRKQALAEYQAGYAAGQKESADKLDAARACFRRVCEELGVLFGSAMPADVWQKEIEAEVRGTQPPAAKEGEKHE